MNDNLFRYNSRITRKNREALNKHKAIAIWFTGLSGAGKSTLAHALEERLHQIGYRTYVLDGDNVRHGLCSDLGFSIVDRTENIRRIGEMTKLIVDAGIITIAAFISPIKEDRERVRSLFSTCDFFEVYCRCPLEVCEQRDVKGLYERARSGEIPNFTGISSAYDEPLNAELIIDTDKLSIDMAVDRVVKKMEKMGVFSVETLGTVG